MLFYGVKHLYGGYAEVEKAGIETNLSSRIVTYADDLVILSKRSLVEEALHYMG